MTDPVIPDGLIRHDGGGLPTSVTLGAVAKACERDGRPLYGLHSFPAIIKENATFILKNTKGITSDLGSWRWRAFLLY